MGKENPQSELARLRNEQNKTRRNEVFGGLSPAERTEYEEKRKRINELEGEIQASAGAEQKKSQSGNAEQRRLWNKNSETDTHQSAAQQPYRSREKDSSDSQERSEGLRTTTPKSGPRTES